MTEFLFFAGLVILVCACAALLLGRWQGMADRMLAVQLVGTSGVAVLMLLAVATGDANVLDVALVVALLAAFSACALRIATAAAGRSPE